MTRLDLPDGQWAELASPRKVSDRRRRAFLSAAADFNAATNDLPMVPGPVNEETGQAGSPQPDPRAMNGEQTELQFAMFDKLVLCFVKAWSLDAPIDLETVQDLDGDTKDVLVKTCLPLLVEMMPDYSPDPDPKAPTSPSAGSPVGLSTGAQLISATTSIDGMS